MGSSAQSRGSVYPVLPDPKNVVISEVSTVCARFAQFREAAADDGEELNRARLIARAIEKLCTRRADQQALQSEERRLESAVGAALLAPSNGFTSKDLDGCNDVERATFTLLGQYRDLMERALDEGKTRQKPCAAFVRKCLAESPEPSDLDLRIGRFQDVLADIPTDSVDLVLTDPPYAACTEEDWHDLAAWSAARLKSGGSLITYVGQGTLPMVLRALDGPLRYWWTLALTHSGGAQQLPGKFVLIKWKPLLWFVKDKRANTEQVSDLLIGKSPDKALHEWAQGAEELEPIIEKLTMKGDLIVDPFAGSGGFGKFATHLGRRWIGADDPTQRP